jgi:hypothetical protein
MPGCVLGFEFDLSLHLFSRRDFRKVEVAKPAYSRKAEGINEARASSAIPAAGRRNSLALSNILLIEHLHPSINISQHD